MDQDLVTEQKQSFFPLLYYQVMWACLKDEHEYFLRFIHSNDFDDPIPHVSLRQYCIKSLALSRTPTCNIPNQWMGDRKSSPKITEDLQWNLGHKRIRHQTSDVGLMALDPKSAQCLTLKIQEISIIPTIKTTISPFLDHYGQVMLKNASEDIVKVTLRANKSPQEPPLCCCFWSMLQKIFIQNHDVPCLKFHLVLLQRVPEVCWACWGSTNPIAQQRGVEDFSLQVVME